MTAGPCRTIAPASRSVAFSALPMLAECANRHRRLVPLSRCGGRTPLQLQQPRFDIALALDLDCAARLEYELVLQLLID